MKHGAKYSFDHETSGYDSYEAGSPEASGDIIILEKFSVEGKEYTVEKIGDYAFAEMNSLTSVVIPSSVKTIGRGSFAACSSLRSVILSEGLKAIEDEAFVECHALTSVVFPDGLESIGASFVGCSGLESVSIPASVKSISVSPFAKCSALTSITIDQGNKSYDSRENSNAIIETNSNKLIVGCKGTVIPLSVSTIGSRAFCSCYGLTELHVPSTVVVIEESAFAHCSDLKGITLSEGLESVGYAAFWYTGLQNITIPASVKSIGNCAFWSPAITTVVSMITNPFEVNGICDLEHQNVTLWVPTGTKTKYEATEGWKQFYTIEELETENNNTADNIVPVSDFIKYSIFDLQGRRVRYNNRETITNNRLNNNRETITMNREPLKPGVYIRNGKKIVKK